jgi:hypothetical protein
LHPRVPDPGPGPSGGWIVNGAWLVADFESFNDIDGMLEATEDFYSEWPQIAQRVVSGKNVVIFPIGPQDHDCRSWIGSTEDGEAAVIVTEFGRIDFDLEADPIRPWGHLASD